MSQKIFCLFNCFNNYDIVASKVMQFYIENAVEYITTVRDNNATPNIKILTYYENTPFMSYAVNILPGSNPTGYMYGKQYVDYIYLLGLVSVCLARIDESNTVIYTHQGMINNPGFASLYNIANQLNKTTVLWTDDLRNLWGTTDDPLVIGMSPLPYKYLWTAGNSTGNPENMVYPKGMNGYLVPNLASDKDLCPKVDMQQFSTNWNTFVDMIVRGENIARQNQAGRPNLRTRNLITIGKLIIAYVETGKDVQYGRGWVPGLAPAGANATLWWDMELIIFQNKGLLYTEEQTFIDNNRRHSANMQTTVQQAMPQIPTQFFSEKNVENLKFAAQSLAKGLADLTR